MELLEEKKSKSDPVVLKNALYGLPKLKAKTKKILLLSKAKKMVFMKSNLINQIII